MISLAQRNLIQAIEQLDSALSSIRQASEETYIYLDELELKTSQALELAWETLKNERNQQ